VSGIGDEDILVAIDRNAGRTVEPAAERVDRRIATGRQDLLHRTVAGIGDKDIAAAIDRNAGGSKNPLPRVTMVWAESEAVALPIKSIASAQQTGAFILSEVIRDLMRCHGLNSSEWFAINFKKHESRPETASGLLC
jgi:hypothetical protein